MHMSARTPHYHYTTIPASYQTERPRPGKALKSLKMRERVPVFDRFIRILRLFPPF
jgi:hypothetical protein